MIHEDELETLKQSELIIFPFGQSGKPAVDTLLAHGFKIHSIWDNMKSGTYQGIPICRPAAGTEGGYPVILCADKRLGEILHQQADQLGYQVYHGGELLRSMELTRREYANNSVLINQRIEVSWQGDHADRFAMHILEIPITERCSLKCRDCSNLMQYYSKPRDADVEKTLADADQIIQAVDHIDEVRLLGGEPFVSKQLYQYVEHFIKQEKVEFIYLYTNATILPKGENLDCLKHHNVFVYISNYGEISKKLTEIEHLFQQEGILYHVSDVTQWTACSSFIQHHRTPQELEDLFGSCCTSECSVLKNGRLYGCPFLAQASTLYAIPKEANEFLQLSDYQTTDALRQALKDFLNKSYFSGCDFCAGRPYGVFNIPAAQQTKEVLPYKKYMY